MAWVPLLEEAAEEAEPLLNEAGEAAVSAYEEAKPAIESAADKVVTTAEDAANAIESGAEKLASDVKDGIQEIQNELNSLSSSAPSTANSCSPRAAPEIATTEPETVDFFHGSQDMSTFPEGQLDPNRSGAFYAGTDPAVAENAISHYQQFDQAPNPGMLQSSIPKDELDTMIDSGDVEVRPYTGYGGTLNQTQEYLFKSPEAKELFNKYLVR